MKALARFGKAFGGYKMIDVPEPVCGPDDVVIEIKAAAICGADMKHYNVDSGSDQFNSIRGHEFAGANCPGGRQGQGLESRSAGGF
jgi:threonine dehydrogenase-like Zn-dependent dehydrogenase